MARIISLVVLVAIVLVIAVLFFKVMADFLIPMFLALLLVVMFGPLHRWFKAKCRGHDRLAAGLTTAAILLIVLVPMALIVMEAAQESLTLYENVKDFHVSAAKVAEAVVKTGKNCGLEFEQKRVEVLLRTGMQTVLGNVQEFLTPLALSTPGYLGRVCLGLFVMAVSLYYFLVDGPGMVRTVMRLSPLDDKYEEQLIAQFDGISRAVVVATLLSAFVQGVLAGIGFSIAGVGAVFLLTILTMLLALIPFIGAAAVWVPVCLWLGLVNGNWIAAGVLAAYGIAIISMADNVIKPLVLHGQANLHPLLALLSVLGGVTALGPIGIFVGPMVVAFLQTLLNMLHTELNALGKGLSTDHPQLTTDD